MGSNLIQYKGANNSANGVSHLFNTNALATASNNSILEVQNFGTTFFEVKANGDVGINMAAFTAPTARLHVKGSGATSATTGLLIENSLGADLFTVKDNGVLNAANLPTSSAGLSSGDIWNNSGVLNIV